MGGIHNTRTLRLILVLGTVVLTIFIYASYSSNAALTVPPHMRAASTMSNGAALPPAVAEALSASADSNHNKPEATLMEKSASWSPSGAGEKISVVRVGSAAAAAAVIAAAKKQHQPPPVPAQQQQQHHHRQPTIDVDAAGSGGGAAGGNALDDAAVPDAVPDEMALANNEPMDEQYVQNIDNILGNINNSIGAQSLQQQQQPHQPHSLQQQSSQQQQQQEPEQRQQPQAQLQQNQLDADNSNTNVNNNNQNNKILDSDVLIPTSNLQKFIENAEKILKNITAPSPAAAINSPEKDAAPLVLKGTAEEEARQAAMIPQQSPSGAAADAINAAPNDDADDAANDDEPAPPSVVMRIKSGALAAAQPQQPIAVVTTKRANGIGNINGGEGAGSGSSGKPKVATKKANVTVVRATTAVDLMQGVATQRIYESGHMNEELNLDKLCPNQGSDLKLLVLITSAQTHADARMAIRQTWAHYGVRRDVSIAFVLGRSPNESLNLALTQENFIYGDLIRGNFIDTYNNLTLKTISSLEWVDENCPKAKFVLKTDDDMFINVPKLLGFLDAHGKEKRIIYGRLAKKWKPIRNKKSKYYVSTGQFSAPVFPPFTTGPAYVMSGDIVHELYQRSLHQVYLKLEDVFTTGIVAQQLGIKRVHVNEFLNRRIAFNPCNIRKTISVHMIKANEQFDLWKKLLDQSTKCK